MAPKTPRERLAQQLAELHAELDSAHRQDPATRKSLGEVLPDVKRMVDEPGSGGAPIDKTLPERLERIAVQFEAQHPTLAASARRLVDLLSEVGI